MRNSNSLEIKYTDFKPGFCLQHIFTIENSSSSGGERGAQMFKFNFIYPVNNAGINQRYLQTKK